MSFTTRVGLLAGAFALTLTSVSSAGPASTGTNDDLAQRLAAAEAKIAAMEAASNQNWLTEQRATEIRGLVQDVLADADSRASLLQAGMTSGYDNGMILGSADGNWLLRTNFLMQQRFIYNNQDNSGGGESFIDSDRWGFENTRSKFILSGHVVNPDWYYLVSINVGSNGGGSPLSDLFDASDNRTGTGNAYLGHDYGNGWKVQMGTMKMPLLREELVEAQYQLAVERSNVNYLFTGGYTDGLQVSYAGDKFQFMGMISDGARQGQTVWSTFDTEWALTARGEFLVNGNWDQFKDFTSMRGGETGVLLGAAVHYEETEHGTPVGKTRTVVLTGDASIEFGGANIFASIAYADIDPEFGSGFSPLGIVVQGGFYLNDTWELFARYEWADYDVSGVDDLSILTGGVTKYFSGHNAKWTTDIGYGINSVLAPANITGFRSDFSDNDGQFVIRTQWQILF